MAKRMLIDALHSEETRVVIADENQVYDFDFISTAKKQLKGNIYLAKITRVEPSLQAAFVEYGGGKQGFLPFAEIHTDYYQIPVSDRKRLLEEAEREMENGNNDDIRDTAATGNGEAVNNNGENPVDTDIANGGALPPDAGFPAQEPGMEQETAEQFQENTLEESPDTIERPAYLMQGAIDLSVSEEVANLAEQNAGNSGDGETENGQQSQEIAETGEDVSGNSASPDGTPTASESAGEEIETLQSDEEELRNKRKRNIFMRRYKIQEVIRRGQIVLMQVIKEERGNKGVSLTTYLSLAGRYCVLMPNSPKDGGISRKIASAEDRKRLKAISTEFRLAEGMSVIIRTAGMDRTHAEIKRDFDYLVKLWNAIREDTLKSNAPALIYEESDIIKRAIRDQYSNDIEEIVIEGDAGYKSAREFMKLLLPSHLPKIKNYTGQTPLFYAYNIEDQLLSMHDPVVKLKSGGYIVINPTEALISIDVNSGRATGERNIEETASKTNLEAAAEIARQLRLRDLAGLIVIDFIDMLESRNRRAVEKMMKDSLKTDRAKIQLGRISPFGLLEMSRQRLRPSISETNMMQCPHCIGRGVIRSNESMSIQIIRSIEKEASNGNSVSLRIIAPQTTALHMLNFKREALRALEERYGLSIQILINPDFTASEFTIEKIRRPQNERGENDVRRPKRQERQERPERAEKQRSSEPQNQDSSSTAGDENNDEASAEGSERPSSPAAGDNAARSRRRRGRRTPRTNANNAERQEKPENDNIVDVDTQETEGETQVEIAADGEGKAAKRPPRERGGRGRRKWRDRGGRNENGEAATIDDTPTSWDGGAAALADGKALPAFASDLRPVAVPAPPTYKAYHDHKPVENPPTQDASIASSPPKRGWWQKMISLDE